MSAKPSLWSTLERFTADRTLAGPRKAFPLRLDSAVHAAVERLAASELRSVNAQIEQLLREALRSRGVKLRSTPDEDPDGGSAS